MPPRITQSQTALSPSCPVTQFATAGRTKVPRRRVTALGWLVLATACGRPLPQADPGTAGAEGPEPPAETPAKTGRAELPEAEAVLGADVDAEQFEEPHRATAPAEAPAPPLPRTAISPSVRAPSVGAPGVVAPSPMAPSALVEHRALSTSARGGVAGRVAKRRLLPHRPTIGHNPPPTSREGYAASDETPFARPTESPLSTFSIDVDTASYANVRRFLHQGQLPPVGAVRVEELVNYFPYDYPEPSGDEPFRVSLELSSAPWNEQHQLLHVGLQGKRLPAAELPPRNLVFLLDVSGSMGTPNKLPLLQRALATLTETLRPQDQIAIAVYAGASGLVLEPTPGHQQARILQSVDRLRAGGSTNGAAGIQLAYDTATRMAQPGSSTRVILATDGDFNVGMTSDSELYRLIESKRQTGVFLSVLGLGMGNYQDATLELLADKGNGNYAYIDSIAEARKVLVNEGGATLTTLAKDVKIQVEFNPAYVEGYRLIGYENRRLAARDFNDDSKDAGELGAGHSVTALYELIPAGQPLPGPRVDPLKYQPSANPQPVRSSSAQVSGELATVKLRYKAPADSVSRLLTHTVPYEPLRLAQTSHRFRFAAAVAAFGMTLSDSKHRGEASLALAQQLAGGALGGDPYGYRSEFQQLVDRAASLRASRPRHGWN